VNDTTYASPFSWRYARPSLRELFSERERRKLWRAVWVALAEAQERAGLVTSAEVADLRAHADEIDLESALAIEREIGHDLMAEIRVYAKQATVGGGKLHLGATSMDVEDTVETFRMRVAVDQLVAALDELLLSFAAAIERHADLVCMGYTHLQPAEPTTLGYRFAVYGQDLLIDRAMLLAAREQMTAKGIRGAVGTSASYTRLLDGTGRTPDEQEADVLERFGLQARDVATQTYPRKLDYLLLSTLAGLGASLSKFAFDVRILASPGFGDIAEPFGAKQVGSSAMPFKRNPVMAERIDSLARLLPAYADVAWQNAATNLLERTLDDSANRRTILPEALLCTDEILSLGEKDRRRTARRRAADRRKPAHLRAVLRDRGDLDGGGKARRRPSGAPRGDPRERDAFVRRPRCRRNEPAGAPACRRRADRTLGRSSRGPQMARSIGPRRRRPRARPPSRATNPRHRREQEVMMMDRVQQRPACTTTLLRGRVRGPRAKHGGRAAQGGAPSK